MTTSSLVTPLKFMDNIKLFICSSASMPASGLNLDSHFQDGSVFDSRVQALRLPLGYSMERPSLNYQQRKVQKMIPAVGKMRILRFQMFEKEMWKFQGTDGQ